MKTQLFGPMSSFQASLLPSDAFATTDLFPGVPLDRLWLKVQLLYKVARTCQQESTDESSWVEVVRRVFTLALWMLRDGRDEEEPGQYEEQDFRLTSIPKQHIDETYLPINTTALTTLDKNADFVLAFNPDHERVKNARTRAPSLPLSPMDDPYTSRLPLVSAVEVMRDHEQPIETQLQLGIWQAAALAHVQSTFPRTDGALSSSPPQIGWTVAGHAWNMYITWQDPVDGAVTVWGPFIVGSYNTSSYHGIFTLLSALLRTFKWFLDTHWPSFVHCLPGAPLSIAGETD
ncbi:hypothetical protein MBLNU459_g3993t1 [Dothideomycetes sp. NU459]